jgi:hypothetical protein
MARLPAPGEQKQAASSGLIQLYGLCVSSRTFPNAYHNQESSVGPISESGDASSFRQACDEAGEIVHPSYTPFLPAI